MHLAPRNIKAKKFLKSGINRNFWAFLFFLVLSGGFWLFLSLEDEYEVDIDIPVVLKNVPKNVVITTELPKTIKLRIQEKGNVILKYRQTQQLGTISLDFNDYDHLSGHVAIPTAEVAKNIVSRLQVSTKIVGFLPDTLEYFFNFGSKRKIPIRLAGKIEPDSLYSLGDTTLSHRYATVYAPQKILDTLRYVETKPFELKDFNTKQTQTLHIAPIRGAKIVPNSITATFDVDQTTEKVVQVPVESFNFPANKSLKTFPGIVNVTFNVGMKQFKSITPDKFAIVISYDEVKNANSSTIDLHLKTMPKGINHVRISPAAVEFLIEELSDE